MAAERPVETAWSPVPAPRPTAVRSVTYRVATSEGAMFATATAVATLDGMGGDPLEVFVQVGKAGSDTAAVAEAIGRLISLILRLPSAVAPGDRLRAVAGRLTGAGWAEAGSPGTAVPCSVPDALADVLHEALAAPVPTSCDDAPGGRARPGCAGRAGAGPRRRSGRSRVPPQW